ncbi:MAG: helix-turn-helix transcriptional regulator [Chloroflexi bacterium]|nr:helix-turn-helix transcriptional regulator [Chloroflexota bacterium]
MGIAEDRRRRDESWDAEHVRRLRRHAGLSQRELAEELNARQQTISEWERGAYEPRGTAARLLTRVAEDVEFPFEAGEPSQLDEPDKPGKPGKQRESEESSEPSNERVDGEHD